MPTTYAHYRFGRSVLDCIPEKYRRIIDKNLNIYDIGVHGPDIFFYYNIGHEDPIRKRGSVIHFSPGREFFENTIESAEKSDKAMSYFFGFFSHYILDSVCHSYIHHRSQMKDVSHNKIEAEYDAHLLRKDGLKPQSYDRSKLLSFSKEDSDAIAGIYGLDGATAADVLTQMKKIIKQLHIWPPVLKPIMKLKGAKPSEIDLIMYNREDKRCKASNMRIDKLFVKAEETYASLIGDLIAFIEERKGLPEYFGKTFEYDENYKDVPILSYEEESEYII